MRTLVFTFICIFFLTTANAQIQLGWESHGLKGEVKALKTYAHYDIDDIDSLVEILRSRKQVPKPHFVRKFNRKGKEIEFRNYNVRIDELRVKTITKYDQDGNLIAKIDFDPDKIPKKDTIVYAYDNNGNKVEAIYPRGDKILYKYDTDGNLIEKLTYNRRGLLNHKQTFQYDPQDNLLVKKEVDAQGNLKSKDAFKYDENGNAIEQTKMRSDRETSQRASFEYDDSGQVIEMGVIVSGTYHKANTIKYDDLGREIEKKRYNKDGSLQKKYVYEYDNQDNKIRYSIYDGNGNLTRERTYHYDYDDKGNWVLKTEFHDGEPYVVIKRELIYY